MQRQSHRSRQPTHAIGRPSASEQTFRLSQSAAPQQPRRGRRTATARALVAAAASVARREGVAALWKGLGPTLWRDVPFSMVYWLGYENLKR